MDKKNVNLKEWKQRHPRLFALVQCESPDSIEGLIKMESNNRKAVEREYRILKDNINFRII